MNSSAAPRHWCARRTRLLITTHSPALLSALDSTDHDGVVVCWRDRTSGTSRLTRLTELDGYPAAMAAGSLGDVITQGRLHERRQPDRDYTEFDRMLGEVTVWTLDGLLGSYT